MYNDRVKCKKRSTTWACQPTCSATAPSNLTISQGSSETTANVSWNVGSGGSSQRLYVDQSKTEVDQNCPTARACEVTATLAAGTNSYIVTGLAPATTYYFRVVTYKSSSCVAATRRSYTTPEENNDITGRVYLDSANVCGSSSGMAGITLYLDGAAAGVSDSDGSYSLTATPGLHSVGVGLPGGYICSTGETCSAGCPTQNNVSAGAAGVNFYLTNSREAWWQAAGAGVYANGSVRSVLPQASTPLLAPGAGGAIGALMRTGGSVETGAGVISTPGYSAITRYRGKTMNIAPNC
ncbi:MAG: fibronectin type III domain-containing protein [Chloroflexi bacterium]|nr:fibronectin type III domain-containing protein [Chloroflexota bacterium]